MMRVYHSVFAAVVNSIAFLQDRTAAKKKTPRVLSPTRARVGRLIGGTLGVVFVVSLLAAANSSARQTIAQLARKSQLRASSWTSPNSLSTKLYRTLTGGYGRYEQGLSGHEMAKQDHTGGSPHYGGNSASAGSMPVVPNMIPLPPDAPPVFTDDPLAVGTFVQALHITELRDAVDLARARVGLAAASWGEAIAPGVLIRAAQILELRARLDDARIAIGLSGASYSDPPPSIGGGIRADHVRELRDRIKEMYSTTANAGTAVARLDPANQTGGGGENPLSRNFNWSVPLVGLPGRSGLDLGLSLSYNSLVWTRSGSSISFDDDRGFPSPGFRLGFPVIHSIYFNSEVGKNAYLLITPNGERVELRQVGSSSRYEAADSSHLLLDTTSMILRTTDGTQLSYDAIGGSFQCTRIKDRNGNFISVNYNALGRIATVVDTLSRTITFNYAGSDLISITQSWIVGNQPPVTHYWARFTYADQTIQTSFPNLTVVGPQNNTALHVLTQVKFGDDSRYDFNYTSWGQVWKVSNFAADGHLLNYRSYNLPQNSSTAQTDCPRFTEKQDWAENWNRSGPLGPGNLSVGAEQEVKTSYAIPVVASWTPPNSAAQTGMRAEVIVANHTDLKTTQRIYFEGTAGTSSGWRRGLATLVETFDSADVLQKQSVTTWTQDNAAVSYILNPRVTESNIYDPAAGNRKRMTINYGPAEKGYEQWGLPYLLTEYAANGTTEIRHTYTDYNLSQQYLDRRIIGLVSARQVSDTFTWHTIVHFSYDAGGSQLVATPATTVQHDAAYGVNFAVGRGNLTAVTRYDVFDINNAAKRLVNQMGYDTNGSLVFARDPAGHQNSISYGDAFSADGTNLFSPGAFATFAYPTTVTDADGFSSATRYHYDFGAPTWKQTPMPNLITNTPGPEQKLTYDDKGRIERITNVANSAYTRFIYGPNYVESFASVNNVADEAHSLQVFDGAGRVIAKADNHPGSIGGFSGQLLQYDVIGRVVKQSNPTETSTSVSGAPIHPYTWSAAGDDAQAGWLYTQQTYDWKGQPRITTNTDTTTKEASYLGCGCAGGEVVTLTDEGTMDAGVFKRRQKRIYSDVLGRTVKTETLNWQGGSVYSATVNTYNVRDQLTLVRQFQGTAPNDLSDLSCPSGTCQKTEMSYDGHGRLKTKHVPEQNADTATTWDYNSDDTVHKITDARGATTTFGYNGRHLVISIEYPDAPSLPAGVQPTANVSFGYDAVGNRTSMIDGMGSMSYGYDQLSRLTSETRTFTSLGTYPLTYTYNLAGAMTSMTDPFGAQVSYNFDGAGRVASVTGSGFAGVSTFASNIQYRAWGDQKSVTYGDNKSGTTSYDSRMRPSAYEFPGLREQFQYYDDGRLRQMTDLDDRAPDIGFQDTARRFSRVLSYDHVGRLTATKGTPQATFPFNQNYAHDAFNNPTSRFGTYYYQSQTVDNGSFSNNRRQNQSWTYHADGQVKHSPLAFDFNFNESVYRDWSYDAAGQMVQVRETVTNPSSVSTFITSYDGDGQPARESTTTSIGSSTGYLIRSSVLDEVVTRIGTEVTTRTTTVNVDGRLKVVQFGHNGTNLVSWTHIDPLGMSEAGDAKPVYDPLGNFIPWQRVPSAPPNAYPPSSPNYGGQGPAFGSSQNRACTIDGTPISCDRAMTMLSHGSAERCPDNNCGPRSIRSGGAHVGWATFNGSGYHVSDGESGAWLFFDELQYGSLLEASKMPLQPKRKRRKSRTSVPEVMKPKYPPVTASEINLVLMPNDPLRGIQDDIVAAIVDISNRQACSDAFKKHNLKIPYDVVKSGNLKVAGLMALNQPNAGELLGWTPDQVDKARAAFEWHWYYNFRKPNIGEGVYAGIPTVVFNAYADFKQLGGLREVVTHAFIHVGGKPGDPSATPHDLGNFKPGYKEIIDACK